MEDETLVKMQWQGGRRMSKETEFTVLYVCVLRQYYTLQCKSYTPLFFLFVFLHLTHWKYLFFLISPSIPPPPPPPLSLSCLCLYQELLSVTPFYYANEIIDVNYFMCHSKKCPGRHLLPTNTTSPHALTY